MKNNNLAKRLVLELETKLKRRLTKKEKALLQWSARCQEPSPK
ncbi:hypothetical protein [Shouchella shacheensis]|nr:hypothetical protein [Shouchella shacheensis]